MSKPFMIRIHKSTLRFRLVAAIFLALVSSLALGGGPDQEKQADPWTSSQVLQASDLARELANNKSADAPTILYVGFRTLFEGGHIPGATFHGTASNEQGLTELKKWAASLPRSTNLVIYCGCCPFDHCPNIRPAFRALRALGFTHLRVLVLPTNFATDWVAKGYPMQKGM